MSTDSDPYFEVWSTVAWDGKNSLLAANLHFNRLERHAKRLGFDLPKGYIEKIFEKLSNTNFSEDSVVDYHQPSYLVKIGVTKKGDVFLIPRINQSLSLIHI